jgi:hypothetical protein
VAEAGEVRQPAAERVLARPPHPPARPDLFSSDSAVGPGIYPHGPPMRPATGLAWSDPTAEDALAALTARLPDQDRAVAHERYRAPRARAAFPDAGVRAAVAALTGTVAEPLLLTATELAGGLTLGTPTAPNRIAGVDAGGRHVVNERYAAEHPGLIAGALAHELLVPGPAANNVEEVLGHGVLAVVQMQLIARDPHLAHLGTELARRQSSFVITLFNSRPPGSPWFRFRAPDGPGTIPGGSAAMQSPDFASVPFTSRDEPGVAPPMMRAVLSLLAGELDLPDPFSYDEDGLAWIDDHLATAWLPATDRVRVGVALGLLSLDDVIEATGLDATDAIGRFDLTAALEPFV